MIREVLVIGQVYLISWGLQFVAWPWLYKFNKKLIDHGWAMGRVLSSLAIALVLWFLGNAKIPANTEAGIIAVLAALIILTWKLVGKQIKPAYAALRDIGWLVVTEEALFLIGFFGYALVRGFQPDILGLEKFMDFGFIKSYLTTPVLPPRDMWWAGGNINYYSFGHLWASVLIRLWGVADGVGYNLMLAFILANSLSLAFCAVVNLAFGQKIAKFSLWLGGLVGAVLTNLGGNSHTIWSLLANRTLERYWYADATRFIHNTIHEFPAYSYVVSDLHGHVLGLPIVLSFIIFWIAWHKEEKNKIGCEVILGIVLGLMAMTNTWDSAVYGLLISAYGCLMIISEPKKIIWLVRSAAIIGGAALLTALPWLISFRSISSGIAGVDERTPVWQFLVLWTGHLLITFSALTLAIRKQGRNYPVLALGLSAIALLLIPEFIYVKDIYTGYQRANTMFKLTYQAFIMMTILAGFVVAESANIKKIKYRLGLMVPIALIDASFLIFPFMAFSVYYNNFSTYRGIDGIGYLARNNPVDWRLINYLETHRDDKNLVEAVGDSYTETDFVSAYSGVPTVLGWRVHEWLWRGGYDEVGKRDGEVREFYEDGSRDNAIRLIQKYNLGWVVVTARERSEYKVNEAKIQALGEVVWKEEGSYLVKIR